MNPTIPSNELAKIVGTSHHNIKSRAMAIQGELRKANLSPVVMENVMVRKDGVEYPNLHLESEIASIIILRCRVLNDEEKLKWMDRWGIDVSEIGDDLESLSRISTVTLYSILKCPNSREDKSQLNDFRSLDVLIEKASTQAQSFVQSDPPAKPLNYAAYPHKQRFPIVHLPRGMSVYFRKSQIKPGSVGSVRQSIRTRESAISRFHGQEIRFLVLTHQGSEWAEICRIL